jgi:hypothetical protein
MQTGVKILLGVIGGLLLIGLSVGVYFLIRFIQGGNKNESSSTCTSYTTTYTNFSDCINGRQSRTKKYSGCANPPPDEIETINCICDTVYGQWTPSDGSCRYGETQTRTIVTSGTNCGNAGTVTETKTCTTVLQ